MTAKQWHVEYYAGTMGWLSCSPAFNSREECEEVCLIKQAVNVGTEYRVYEIIKDRHAKTTYNAKT